jgi:S1-C subfamily serine protease
VIEFEAPSALAVGQKALAIGNPFGLGESLSVGVVSSIGRDIRTPNERLIKNVIQTDAAINPGNSGGALLDSSGHMIGIDTQIYSTSGGNEGIGFAISAETVKRVVDQLIQFGRVLRPDLGINGVGFSDQLLKSLEIPIHNGVMITDMDPHGPAAKAGMRAADKEVALGFRRFPYGGDLIYQIDHSPISTFRDILDYITDKKIGESITVHYLRGKAKHEVTIRLSTPPAAGEQSL